MAANGRSGVEDAVRGQGVTHEVAWEGVSLQKCVFIERGEQMNIRINGTDAVVRVTHQDGVLIEVERQIKHACVQPYVVGSFSVTRIDE